MYVTGGAFEKCDNRLLWRMINLEVEEHVIYIFVPRFATYKT